MTLMLEDMSNEWPNKQEQLGEYSDPDVTDYSSTEMSKAAIFDPLSQMYSALHEEDLWAGLWLKYAKYPETNNAIAYEQMGFFEEAQGAYDLIMTKYKQDAANGPTPLDMNSELLLWETHWLRCAKELNQWDIILDYAQMHKKWFLIMESAWRVPDWALMKQALLRVEGACPKQDGYKVNLYRGFLAILNQEEQHLSSVERYVEIASVLCMREWRRLPHIVSHIHLPILQAAQQIMELQEACQIHQGLLQCRLSSLHDMKAIVKTWRNRLPVVADDLSHWSGTHYSCSGQDSTDEIRLINIVFFFCSSTFRRHFHLASAPLSNHHNASGEAAGERYERSKYAGRARIGPGDHTFRQNGSQA